jgi:hypothetical protein
VSPQADWAEFGPKIDTIFFFFTKSRERES